MITSKIVLSLKVPTVRLNDLTTKVVVTDPENDSIPPLLGSGNRCSPVGVSPEDS